jgi:hypothetical protein
MIILDAIIQWLDRASESNRDDQVVPAVILWLDKERQSERLLLAQRDNDRHLILALKQKAEESDPQMAQIFADDNRKQNLRPFAKSADKPRLKRTLDSASEYKAAYV